MNLPPVSQRGLWLLPDSVPSFLRDSTTARNRSRNVLVKEISALPSLSHFRLRSPRLRVFSHPPLVAWCSLKRHGKLLQPERNNLLPQSRSWRNWMKLLDEASGFGIGEQLGACLTLANFTLKVASFVRGTFLCMNAMQATDERKFEICSIYLISRTTVEIWITLRWLILFCISHSLWRKLASKSDQIRYFLIDINSDVHYIYLFL